MWSALLHMGHGVITEHCEDVEPARWHAWHSAGMHDHAGSLLSDGHFRWYAIGSAPITASHPLRPAPYGVMQPGCMQPAPGRACALWGAAALMCYVGGKQGSRPAAAGGVAAYSDCSELWWAGWQAAAASAGAACGDAPHMLPLLLLLLLLMLPMCCPCATSTLACCASVLPQCPPPGLCGTEAAAYPQ
jgi:hypothetical protein